MRRTLARRCLGVTAKFVNQNRWIPQPTVRIRVCNDLRSAIGAVFSVPLSRCWLPVIASATLLFCSCKTITPDSLSPDALNGPHASRVSENQPAANRQYKGQSAEFATGVSVASRASFVAVTNQQPLRSPLDQRDNVSRGAKLVTPQQLDTRRQASYPVVRTSYSERATLPDVRPAPLMNATTLRVTSNEPIFQPTPARHVSGRQLPPQYIWRAQQISNHVSLPPTGHSCAACQPYSAYPPSLPTMPHAGGASPWSKPWQYGPWPPDEYIYNGGDNDLSVQVADDWSVIGLHEGDTVAHYDTLEGQVVVEPTNEVSLYAPQFASVRRVTGVISHEQHLRSAGLELPVHLALSADAESATTVLQPVQPGRNLAITSLNRFRDKMRPGGLENLQAAAGTEGRLLLFEDFLIIRTGQFDNSEKARLSTHLQAAYTWSHDASVQVVVDNIDVLEMSNDVGMQSVYTYEMPDGKPRLRLVKIASKQNAKPGDTVDFTIRFDNVGDRIIGNVTLMDNLHTRLEYVPDSQECTIKAVFSASDNEHDSSVLRWEITDPMKVGTGGVIRFQCRVR